MSISCYAVLTPKSMLQSYEYPEPLLKPHEVLIEITHCGLCHSDLHLIDNDWGISSYPLIPGHEVIGHIVKKGNAVSYLTFGERVGVSWQHSSCLHCEYCLQGNDNLCAEKTMTCVGRPGGFAKKMIADHRFVFPIPKEIDSAHAAPLLCAGATVYAPLVRYGIQAHHVIGVIGIGGLGHLALQFAKAIGCHVIAISRSKDKEKEALQFGAAKMIVVQNESELLNHAGSIDLILSTAPFPLNWTAILNLLKPNGKLCFLGKPQEDVPVPIGLLTSGQKSVTGSTVSPRWILTDMLRFANRHELLPKIEQMPMKEVNTAIERLKKNDVRYRFVLKN